MDRIIRQTAFDHHVSILLLLISLSPSLALHVLSIGDSVDRHMVLDVCQAHMGSKLVAWGTDWHLYKVCHCVRIPPLLRSTRQFAGH